MWLVLALSFVITNPENTRRIEVAFDSDISYSGYILDFGDGKTAFQSSDEMPTKWVRTHKYEKSGQYVVTLLILRGDRVIKALSKMVRVRSASEGDKET